MIAQSDLKDLSVHTEMYVDGFVDIAAAGKITGRHKALDKGRQVFAFAAGSQRMYDYMDHNADVMGAPVDYTNDVQVIGQIDNFISINNAIDLDLFGQVNAESAGIKHISGTGGQLDFAMGAYLSKGGKSFICLSSTVTGKDGTVKSRIVPTLTPGSICHRPPLLCPLYRHRVRHGQPEGPVHLAAGRGADLPSPTPTSGSSSSPTPRRCTSGAAPTSNSFAQKIPSVIKQRGLFIVCFTFHFVRKHCSL